MIRSQSFPQKPASATVRLLWNVSIPMRDGIHLHATVFLPRGSNDPLPAIAEMTPYNVDSMHDDGIYFANHGYAYVAIDCRGRGDSEGRFSPFAADALDFHDAIGWIAAQPWCSGGVGLYGSSYSGMNQWAALATRPPALKTIIPAGAGILGHDGPRGGIPWAHSFSWGILCNGRPVYWKSMTDEGIWMRELFDVQSRGGSITDMFAKFGMAPRPDELQLMGFSHPQWGPYWQSKIPNAQIYPMIDIPVLGWTGHYDSTQIGTLEHFRRFERYAPEQARRLNHLVIGPWGHGGMEGSRKLGQIGFGPAAMGDFKALKIAWYDWVFKGAEKPAFLVDRVIYYVAGREEWRSAPSLDEVSLDEPKIFPLAPAGGINDAFHSGTLMDSQPPEATEDFFVDLDDIAAMENELTQRASDAGLGDTYGTMFPDPHHNLFTVLWGDDPTDQSYALDLHGQGLVYHTRQLSQDIEIAGCPRLQLRIELDAPDVDIAVLLYEIRKDGSAIQLSTALQRLRFHEGWGQESENKPGVPFDVALETFRFTARHIPKGSRLRLVIRAVSGLWFERNPGTAQSDGRRRAQVRLHLGGGHGTQLQLPLARTNERHPTLNP